MLIQAGFAVRPSHSMSLGVDYELHEGRSDTSACPVVCSQTCSHTRQCWEYWKPSVAESRNNMHVVAQPL